MVVMFKNTMGQKNTELPLTSVRVLWESLCLVLGKEPLHGRSLQQSSTESGPGPRPVFVNGGTFPHYTHTRTEACA